MMRAYTDCKQPVAYVDTERLLVFRVQLNMTCACTNTKVDLGTGDMCSSGVPTQTSITSMDILG
jgi:hypothetical protein